MKDNEYAIPHAQFVALFQNTSKDALRPAMGCIHLATIGADKFAVSTNGHTMYYVHLSGPGEYRKIPFSKQQETHIINIPRDIAEPLTRAKYRGKYVEIVPDMQRNTVSLCIGGAAVSCGLAGEERYPMWRAVVPEYVSTLNSAYSIEVSPKDCARIARECSAWCPTEQIAFMPDGSARYLTGEFADDKKHLPNNKRNRNKYGKLSPVFIGGFARVSGLEKRVGFNANYIARTLKNIGAKQSARIYGTEPNRAHVLFNDETRAFALVMPVMLGAY